MFIAIAFGIGFVAGLRSMTAPAAVALAKHSPLLGPLFVVFAFAEYVIDKLPTTPSRLRLPSIVLRPLSGALCAWFLVGGYAAAAAGVAGAFVGAVAGAKWRGYFAQTGKISDLPVGIVEDLVSIALAYLVVRTPF
jgi:uncharacterized membrane protein